MHRQKHIIQLAFLVVLFHSSSVTFGSSNCSKYFADLIPYPIGRINPDVPKEKVAYNEDLKKQGLSSLLAIWTWPGNFLFRRATGHYNWLTNHQTNVGYTLFGMTLSKTLLNHFVPGFKDKPMLSRVTAMGFGVAVNGIVELSTLFPGGSQMDFYVGLGTVAIYGIGDTWLDSRVTNRVRSE